MNFDPKRYAEDLLFAPLGGAGEIGMNLNLYYYKGKWLMIDLGITFATEEHPGVDVIVPNVEFIEKHRKDLVGLVLTHAHEDHLGAVQYLWHDLQCPIYTTKFTATVLRTKLAESGVGKQIKIIEVDLNSRFHIGPFDLELCGLTHSIPEMQAVMLRTSIGNVLHTGDWKLDNSPVIGEPGNRETLEKFGDEGVLAMVGDSTNIFTEGESGSEGELAVSIQNLVEGFRDNLLVVTTFASNIARLHSIAKAGQVSGRKVILSGRSLWRMYESALNSGYLHDLQPLLTEDQMPNYSRGELMVICTGCQGESRAAMYKLASDEHPRMKLHHGDGVIFSSKIIPGNEKKIYLMMNKLCSKGVEVLTENDHFVHVSGHPARAEVAAMYQMIRPRFAIPVHGEAMHIHEHAKFARAHGVEGAIEVKNGDVVRIHKEGVEKVATVKSGYMAVDGNFIIPVDSKIINLRRRMRDEGLVVVTLVMNKTSLAKPPSVLAPGSLDEGEDSEIIASIIDEIYDMVGRSDSKKRTTHELDRSVRTIVRRIMKREVGKSPFILLQIERI